jgi:AcrR family transcriptional regulator
MPRSKSYNRDHVLQKAMCVFWENGYEATTVRVLEKEMGINQFSIYASFNDKKSLFIESLRRYKHYIEKNVFNDLLREDADISDIELFLNEFSEKIKDGKFSSGCLMANTAAEIGQKDEIIHDEVKRYFEFVGKMFKGILERSQKKGDISLDADIEKCSGYLVGIMQGLSVASKIMSQKQLCDFIHMSITSIHKF